MIMGKEIEKWRKSLVRFTTHKTYGILFGLQVVVFLYFLLITFSLNVFSMYAAASVLVISYSS